MKSAGPVTWPDPEPSGEYVKLCRNRKRLTKIKTRRRVKYG